MMNHNTLKNCAPAVRRQLMEAVERKLDFVLTGDTPDLRAKTEQRASLKGKADKDRDSLIERVAYTWFNRFAALRFIDARGWHPFLCRVLTPASAEETQPEILKLTRNGALPAELAPFVNTGRINDLLDGRIPSPDSQGEVYRDLVLAACRYYHKLMPFLFEALDDETELLLPDDLLTEHSVDRGFRTAITDEDCSEVEIIGWLCQYYISEKKDQVMARKSAVPSEDIPAVTQLFTPHWIVRYLVENSLGRLWLLNRPNSLLREHMPYYIEDETETEYLKIARPEEIRLLDPASGSGHMLTYAFDLLYLIYEEEGHAPSEIPGLILRHNLFGLEICPRATQLAQFALVCKTREKSRTAFRNSIQPQVVCLEDVDISPDEMKDYLRSPGLRELFTEKGVQQIHQFRENTPTFGSLIQPVLIEEEIVTLKSPLIKMNPGEDLLRKETHRKILCALDQAEMLSQRYHVVIANPPYMGRGGMNADLKRFAEQRYPESKADLFAMFIERVTHFALPNAYACLVTMHSWMFLPSFETLRKRLINNLCLISMLHLGARAFDTITGEVVQTTAFVLCKSKRINHRPHFRRLISGRNELEKQSLFSKINIHYQRLTQKELLGLPGGPLAYWVNPSVLKIFQNAPSVGSLTISDGQTKSGNNDKFLRQVWEVSSSQIGMDVKWALHPKGGNDRKWYGNVDTVIDWSESARRHYREDHVARILPEYLWKKIGICWTLISSNEFPGFRILNEDEIFNLAAPSLFPKSSTDTNRLLALLNSKVAAYFLSLFNPTINRNIGDVSNVPVLAVDKCANTCADFAIHVAKTDWDNFETSWDFRDQPLLRPGLKGAKLEASWRNWEVQSTAAIRRMQVLETENNRLFIDAYGLQDEISPEVPEDQITLARPDRRKDVNAFLSYAVGCMMGRFSLDASGLILADVGSTLQDYLNKLPETIVKLTFTADEDGIIPLLDREWFEDDIVARTREFLRATFSEETLEENIRFIEESLGKDLRKYYLTDFYKDHLQTYKKRPIYWLFQSPKKGFSALVYLHRYTRDTVNVLLNSYLREYLHKLNARIEHLEQVQANSGNTREKTAARKESDALKKTLRECEEYEREIILPLAQQRIELDLDDGVKVNYLKLGNALAPIPGLAAKEED